MIRPPISSRVFLYLLTKNNTAKLKLRISEKPSSSLKKVLSKGLVMLDNYSIIYWAFDLILSFVILASLWPSGSEIPRLQRGFVL